ncbi:MAG: hypothetical protein J6W36_05745 [Clostridiales bacterium]|nr:hypothetical protein [Clostridiales bacterium]
MTDLFLKVLEMSVMGSVVILVTILTRFLLRKRSKRFIMILWAVVAVRLLIPLNIGSSISIFNYLPLNTCAITSQVTGSERTEGTVEKGYVETEELIGAVEYKADTLVTASEDSTPDDTDQSRAASQSALMQAKAMPGIRSILAVIWLAGTFAILSYMAVRYILLKIKLRDAAKTDRNVYESDKVKSPFVFGLFVPKIYLPDVLGISEKEYILMHERTHIRRGDWLRKILGMSVVAIHWFNPFAWLAFVLFGQDIEMCCDEMTVAGMNSELKKAYAISIVNYAKRSNNRRYLVTTLGFSNGDTYKSEAAHRVKNILNYRKGTKLTTVIITVTLLFMSVSLALNSKPVIADEELQSADVKIEAPVQRQAPFNYATAVPKIVRTSGNVKTVAFFRDGKAISGKLNLPEGEGPYKTIILLGVPNGPGYEKLTKSFTDNGYAVVMFEPNLADEDYTAPAPNNGLVFHTLLDLYAVMDELRYLPDVDLSNVYLWGHQSGGAVAAYAGTDRQSEIKGMVLVEPEFDEYTLSEEPLLKVNIYDILPNCSVPAAVVWGTLHPTTRPAEKAVDLLQNGKLVVLDGNSYSRTFEDSFAERTAEVTINFFNS